MTTLPAWCGPWIGLPFRLRARGPDAYDCWGLYRAVLADRTGVVLPACEEGYPRAETAAEDLAGLVARHAAGAARIGDWRMVQETPDRQAPPAAALRLYDAVLMWRRGHPCHVGMIVAPGWILHIEGRAGSVAQRLTDPDIARSVDSIWRHASQEVAA